MQTVNRFRRIIIGTGRRPRPRRDADGWRGPRCSRATARWRTGRGPRLTRFRKRASASSAAQALSTVTRRPFRSRKPARSSASARAWVEGVPRPGCRRGGRHRSRNGQRRSPAGRAAPAPPARQTAASTAHRSPPAGRSSAGGPDRAAGRAARARQRPRPPEIAIGAVGRRGEGHPLALQQGLAAGKSAVARRSLNPVARPIGSARVSGAQGRSWRGAQASSSSTASMPVITRSNRLAVASASAFSAGAAMPAEWPPRLAVPRGVARRRWSNSDGP